MRRGAASPDPDGRAAVRLAAVRPDRADAKLLQILATELTTAPDGEGPDDFLRPIGEHCIPEDYGV